jgi:hypothetical protein
LTAKAAAGVSVSPYGDKFPIPAPGDYPAEFARVGKLRQGRREPMPPSAAISSWLRGEALGPAHPSVQKRCARRAGEMKPYHIMWWPAPAHDDRPIGHMAMLFAMRKAAMV